VLASAKVNSRVIHEKKTLAGRSCTGCAGATETKPLARRVETAQCAGSNAVVTNIAMRPGTQSLIDRPTRASTPACYSAEAPNGEDPSSAACAALYVPVSVGRSYSGRPSSGAKAAARPRRTKTQRVCSPLCYDTPQRLLVCRSAGGHWQQDRSKRDFDRRLLGEYGTTFAR
jgi:hypothetical protein